MTAAWPRWSVAAVAAGASAGLLDALVAMGRHGERLATRGERVRFGLELAGSTALALALANLAAFALVAIARRLPRGTHAPLVGIAALALGTLAGFAGFSGSAMRRSPLRPWAIVATGLVAGALALGAHARRDALAAFARRHAQVTRFGALGLAALLYAAHALVLVRLYPGVHAFVAAAAVGSLVVALALGEGPGRRAVAAIALALALAAGVAGARGLMRSQAQRALARQRAPLGGYLVRALAPLAPQARVAGVVRDDRILGGRHLDFTEVDVVLVTVDAFRVDRVGAYGGPRALMPTLDAMAAAGAVFERAYCTTPHTSYSLASLMTGKYFRQISRLGAPARPHATLAGVLGRAGFATAGFYPPAIFAVDAERLGDLRARAFDFEYTREGYQDAPRRVSEVARYLDTVAPTRRLFLWVHLFEPHEPYEPHAPSRVARGATAPQLYDGEIAAVDDAIAALRAEVARRGRRAVWIVTGDHGEEFGDHGGRFHGTTVYDEQVRVPLVIFGPGVPATRVATPASLVDVMPTVLAALELPRPPRLRGRDLGPTVYGERPPVAVFASAATQMMVVEGRDKLICDASEGSCELFDLARDPRERVNEVDLRAPRAGQLRALLNGWQESHGRFEQEQDVAVAPTPAVLERALQGDATAALPVAALLDTADARVARLAVRALAELNARAPEVRDALARLAERARGSLAREAGVALALLGDARGEGAARAALAQPDVATQRRGALGLGRLGRAEGVPALAAWAADPGAPDAERDAAIDVLEALGDRRALGTWVALLDDPRVSPTAARALGALRDPRAIAPLHHAVQTTRYARTRQNALAALIALGAPSARDDFVAALAEPDGLVDAFALAAALHEPGVALAGIAGPLTLAPGRARVVPLAGPRVAGPVWLLARFAAPAATRGTLGGAPFDASATRADVRLELAALPRVLRARVEAPVELVALLVVPRPP